MGDEKGNGRNELKWKKKQGEKFQRENVQKNIGISFFFVSFLEEKKSDYKIRPGQAKGGVGARAGV